MLSIAFLIWATQRVTVLLVASLRVTIQALASLLCQELVSLGLVHLNEPSTQGDIVHFTAGTLLTQI